MSKKRKDNSWKKTDRQLQVVYNTKDILGYEIEFYRDLSAISKNHFVVCVAEKLCAKMDELVSDLCRMALFLQNGKPNEVLKLDFELCEKVSNIVKYCAHSRVLFDNYFLIETLEDTYEKLEKAYARLDAGLNGGL